MPTIDQTTDLDRAAFLNDLDNLLDIEVTDEEASFLEEHLGKQCFTDSQRVTIARLRSKYGKYFKTKR